MFFTNSTNNHGHHQQQQRHEPPAVLLIAPTTSLIASLSILKPYQTDAALRIITSTAQSKSSTTETDIMADTTTAATTGTVDDPQEGLIEGIIEATCMKDANPC